MKWIHAHKREWFILLILLGLAAFMRLYRIDEYMAFLGDEGRDALIIKGVLIDHNLPFIGPPTSVGTIYLGPLYYYMMTLSMAIGWLNPVAAAVMVALIGVATVGLIWWMARLMFGSLAGVVAGLLYSLSFVTVIYGRSSWNPNPAPFFTLLAMACFMKAHQTGRYVYLVGVGAFVAAAIQMHYLCLILLPIFGCLVLLELKYLKMSSLRSLFLGITGGVVAFLVLFAPWILFELKHNFMNSRGLVEVFFGHQGAVDANPFLSLLKMGPIYFSHLIGRYIAGDNFWLALVTGTVLLGVLGIGLWKKRNSETIWYYYLLAIWLGVGLLGLSFYKQDLYDHYLGFLSPVPFLLVGGLVGQIQNSAKWQWVVVGVLVMVLLGVNVIKNPLLSSPNRQLQRTQAIAQRVIELSNHEPYNFALIAERNYDAAYQYYLWSYGHEPQTLPYMPTEQLLVVCEDAVCQPINNPKYEIAAFGMIKSEYQEQFQGVQIYKLVHNNR